MKKLALKIHLDEDHDQWLREEAELKRCSIAQVIRTLIAEAKRRMESE